MGMFDGFGNNCIVNPPCPPQPHLQPCKPNKPYEEYDIEGNLIGYWWYYGDTINLQFNITGEVTYEDNDTFMSAEDFLLDKQITVQLFNFRREEISNKTYPGSTTIVFEIDKELSNILVKGVYYVSLTVWKDNNFNQTIFKQQDCVLTVK